MHLLKATTVAAFYDASGDKKAGMGAWLQVHGAQYAIMTAALWHAAAKAGGPLKVVDMERQVLIPYKTDPTNPQAKAQYFQRTVDLVLGSEEEPIWVELKSEAEPRGGAYGPPPIKDRYGAHGKTVSSPSSAFMEHFRDVMAVKLKDGYQPDWDKPATSGRRPTAMWWRFQVFKTRTSRSIDATTLTQLKSYLEEPPAQSKDFIEAHFEGMPSGSASAYGTMVRGMGASRSIEQRNLVADIVQGDLLQHFLEHVAPENMQSVIDYMTRIAEAP